MLGLTGALHDRKGDHCARDHEVPDSRYHLPRPPVLRCTIVVDMLIQYLQTSFCVHSETWVRNSILSIIEASMIKISFTCIATWGSKRWGRVARQERAPVATAGRAWGLWEAVLSHCRVAMQQRPWQ